jgi:hypothetical protein
VTRVKQSRVYDASWHRLLDAVDAALEDIGASGIRWPDEDLARASMGFSFWSYGEDLTVEVFDDGEVTVRSECSFPLQWIDWGKNARNCRRLLDAIDDRLDDDRPRRRRRR